MALPWHKRFRRIAAVGAAILWYRRLTGSRRISRVLVKAPNDQLTELLGAHVSAQPIAVVSADRIFQWAHSPQLKRSPTSADILWKDLPPPKDLSGRSLFAAVDGFSYYHWLLGTLPKLLCAQGQSFDRYIVNPRHKGRINFQTETLKALGLDINKVLFLDRGLHFRCDNMILPPEPTFDEQTKPHRWAVSRLRGAFLPLAVPPVVPAERLFIRRASARRRRLVDEPKIELELSRRGFTAVTLEDLPWAEQVGLFAQARVVVGLHGAGLSNLVFSAPGTSVVEILPRVWRNPCFANLAASIGASYASVAADAAGERRGFAADAQVDLDRLLAAVRR